VLDDAEAGGHLADPHFDPRTEVVLAPSPTAPTLVGGQPQGVATFEIDQPEHVRIAVRAAADSLLVLSDSWFPGWVATVDGAEVPIERANILFRAVLVPAGEHVVEFRYQPRSLQVGAMVSAASILMSVVLLVIGHCWLRRRQPETAL
jgi:hypothetical protein